MRIAARAAVGAIGVGVLTLGLWRIRDILILLLLALTFAAALRPGVVALKRRGVPEAASIFFFLALIVGVFVLFFWLALPPAVHQVQQALAQPLEARGHGLRHDVLAWVEHRLRDLPSGTAVLHPVATYGKQATAVVAGVFFTIAATWYSISERDRIIDVVLSHVAEEKRERTRRTLLAIDGRLGRYVRLMFLMIVAVAVVVST